MKAGVGELPPDNLFNMDETFMQWCGKAKRIVVRRGQKHCKVEGPSSKSGCTVAFTIRGSGHLEPPYIIMKVRKKFNPSLNSHNYCSLHVSVFREKKRIQRPSMLTIQTTHQRNFECLSPNLAADGSVQRPSFRISRGLVYFCVHQNFCFIMFTCGFCPGDHPSGGKTAWQKGLVCGQLLSTPEC